MLAFIDPPFGTPIERLRAGLALQLIVNASLAQQKDLDFDLSIPNTQLVEVAVRLSLNVMNAPIGPLA